MGGNSFSKEDCAEFTEKVCSKQSKPDVFPWHADVEVDWNGCRKFGSLPPVGEHPRLFFTVEDIPRIVARFTHSSLAPRLKTILKQTRDWFLKHKDIRSFPDVSDQEINNPTTKETVDLFFRGDEGRNSSLVCTYVYGIIFEDKEAAERAKQYAVFHAKILLKAREIAIQQNIRTNPYSFWHTKEWTVPYHFLVGGTSYALLYDLMYNELTDEEKQIIRKAIYTVLEGRSPWGLGWPTRRIQSNWAAYHGDFFNLSAVIEGEDKNYDVSQKMAMFADLMTHFLDYAIYDSGHPVEDAYALNLALREGSICFLAMARRGHNVFNHPRRRMVQDYKKIWTNWLPYALEPDKSGRIYAGSSGNEWCYPTSAIIAKYMFPKDPTVDHVYRHFMCENGREYSRLSKGQCRLPSMAFAIPAFSAERREVNVPEKLKLPLHFTCLDRGKVVMRSDWSENAMWFTIDARPDAFLIGHDTCSRGAFVLSAGGRNWGHCPEWKHFQKCSDYSLPLIDNQGQQVKAPSVHLLNTVNTERFNFAHADLTYAYNWAWRGAHAGQDFSKQGFEIEPNDPRDFGFNAWWTPHRLHGEKNVGFVGLFFWRKRIASVKNVKRSAILVRSRRPFVVIADDVEKDEHTHDFTWAMTTPGDVSLESFDGQKAVLKENEGPKKLVVHNINSDLSDLSCTFKEVGLPYKAPSSVQPKQIRLSYRGQKVKFLLLMYSIGENEHALVVNWEKKNQDRSVCAFVDTNTELKSTQRIVFTTEHDENGGEGTQMSLLRTETAQAVDTEISQ